MALKIVYKICCGIDVHKTFVVACIASTNDKGITSYESHRFSTYTSGLKTLLQWLLDRNCKDVCMESTGKYWIPVYNILESDCSIVLAHPKYVKAIRGKKTDKKDAKWIADLFKHDLVAGSFMPSADIRQLRDLMRYRFKLTCFKSSEKNRLQNCLTVSNIQLGNVVSDTFGKSAQAILDKLLENPADTSFDLEPLVYKSLKKKLPELRDAIDGYITPEQAGKLKVIKAHYENLESRKAELEELILALAAPYQQELTILQTAPGISSPFTAIGIISKSVPIWRLFLRRNTCAHGLGLHQPTMKAQGRKICPGVQGRMLHQTAFSTVRKRCRKSTKHPEMRNRYLRLKKRRGHKKAIIAIARMLLTALYHMLKNGENYNAELYQKSDLLPVDREITVEQALMIARNQGYKIKSATA